mgnify:CR=1 FL=1
MTHTRLITRPGPVTCMSRMGSCIGMQSLMGKSWFIVGIVLIGVTLFLLPRIALDHGSLIITILSIQVVFLCVPFIWIEFLLSRHFK